MERLTNAAQGYCEVYCKKYGYCFVDPGDCLFKSEVAMYEKLKDYETAFKGDRLLYLMKAEREGRLVVLPCNTHAVIVRDGIEYSADHWNHTLTAYADDQTTRSGKRVALFSIPEAEAALKEVHDNG